MGGMTGLEAVTEIRKTDETLIIAFITSSADHALESCRLDALKYTEKPVTEKAVLELLTFAQLKKENTPRSPLRVGGKERSLPFGQIVFVEQIDHTLHLHLVEGEILETTGKLTKIEPQFARQEGLPLQPFFRCHKSSLRHVPMIGRMKKSFNPSFQ